jgi:hypothetical protein
MSKKPSFDKIKEMKLREARKQLAEEMDNMNGVKTLRTTVLLDAKLLFAIKDLCLTRRKKDRPPYTFKGVLEEGLNAVLEQHENAAIQQSIEY